MLKGLTHAALRVTDLDRSIEFYTKVIGLEETFRLKNDSGITFLVYLKVADRQFIELFPGAAAEHVDTPSSGLVHLCLEVDDIHKAYEEMTARGLTSLRGEPICAADNSWQFWTQDPDANQIEFHQFTPESMQINP